MKEFRKPDVKAPRFRPEVYNILSQEFFSKFKEKYPKYKNLDNKDLIKIINDERIKNLFTEILVKNYYSYLKKNQFLESNNNFVFNEVLSTFLANLQIIVRSFIREIYVNSEKYEPNNNLYKKMVLNGF